MRSDAPSPRSFPAVRRWPQCLAEGIGRRGDAQEGGHAERPAGQVGRSGQDRPSVDAMRRDCNYLWTLSHTGIFVNATVNRKSFSQNNAYGRGRASEDAEPLCVRFGLKLGELLFSSAR